jgi:hypothetical protein
MWQEIDTGSQIEVAIATEISLEVDGRSEGASLAYKGTRRLIEKTALVTAEINGDDVHNL